MEHLCSLDQIPNYGSKGFQHRGLSLFVIRQNQRVFAYRNSCPHLGIALEWVEDRFLNRDSELILCSTHGALFTIHDGKCVFGPCLGKSLQPIPIHIEGDSVQIDLSLLANSPSII